MLRLKRKFCNEIYSKVFCDIRNLDTFFAHLHRLAATRWGRTFVVNSIVVYYALVLYVWLNYAVHAIYHN